MEDYTELSSYKKLSEHFENTGKKIDLCKEFNEDLERQATFCRKNTFENNSGNTAKIIFDFSKNLIDKETFSLLLEFAEEVKLKEYIECFFSGAVKKSIKCTESQKKRKYQDDFKYETNLNIYTICKNMRTFSENIRSQEYKSVFNINFSSIVIIGINSNNINSEIVSNAFSNIGVTHILYFVGNTEGSRIEDILKKIDFKTTLFIISSKTFTDKDTMLSAEAAKKFIKSHFPNKKIHYSNRHIRLNSYMNKNFVAISNNRKLVKDFGISDSNRFAFCDWIDDGVFSFWAEMILPMSIRIGFDNYYIFLEGLYSMDMHFRYTPIKDNMPVIMALLDFWYENFWGAKTFPILPYDNRLASFATNFERIDTESEKKSSIGVGLDLDHQLGPSIWNESGDNNRRMLYQLIHQEKEVIPCDLIAVVKKQKSDLDNLHYKLALSNFFALSEALMEGSNGYKTFTPYILRDSSKVDSQKENTIVHKAYAGNKPSSSIMIASDITPTLNSQDFKLLKYFAKNILTELNTDGKVDSHNKSTNELINFYKDNSK
ncbi:hypothetical protein BB561_004159 [Smittium simulii]|uniref:Glucose-6-phosphate isomerase n=1 Tax=Smittium simulii TaxID=133385 RepID=A0A2T9YHR6_9FUNG|nr:hypothetical protein BB561_004159 [Smittium simulii]